MFGFACKILMAIGGDQTCERHPPKLPDSITTLL
jgi:hypothetical protein